jgi:hypothetical protein
MIIFIIFYFLKMSQKEFLVKKVNGGLEMQKEVNLGAKIEHLKLGGQNRIFYKFEGPKLYF